MHCSPRHLPTTSKSHLPQYLKKTVESTNAYLKGLPEEVVITLKKTVESTTTSVEKPRDALRA